MSKYVQDVTVRTSDLDSTDYIKPAFYLECCQDLAGIHADMLGVGYDYCINKNIAWVLTKTKLVIQGSPVSNEKVLVTTWPSETSRIDFKRDYLITSTTGKVYAEAVSQWVLVDFVSRKILRANSIDFPVNENLPSNFTEKFTKIPLIDYESMDVKYSYKFQNNDLDHYKHVNNVKYVELLFNMLDEELNKKISTLEINYLNESRLGDLMNVYYEINAQKIIGLGYNLTRELVSFSFEIELK